MKFTFHTVSNSQKDKILDFIKNFRSTGTYLADGRNSIKLFDLEGKTINIKSFKVPNAVNKIVYRFFRRSKAERSFNYALHLIANDIGTPQPLAYAEETSLIAFKKSFYVSEHLDYDLTYRELVQQPDYPNNDRILRAFTRFTYELHQKNIEFLDHSPGNTLIRINNNNYEFFLVDLNRMNFKELSFEERMKNFSRLTPKKEMVEVMACEYSKLINKPEEEVFNKMWFYTQEFQEKFHKKQHIKKKLKLKK